jgi:hypothetical protein
MKQRSKVILVLVVFGIGFVAVTLTGDRSSNMPGSMEEVRQNEAFKRLQNVSKRLPSPMPSIGGFIVLVGTSPVTIEVPCSDGDFRQADLSLLSGPPVDVKVTDNEVTDKKVTDDLREADPRGEAQKLPSDGGAGKDRQKVGVIISGRGGTIVLTQEPQDEDTASTPEPQCDKISCVRFE